jgi:hypothetical protein
MHGKRLCNAGMAAGPVTAHTRHSNISKFNRRFPESGRLFGAQHFELTGWPVERFDLTLFSNRLKLVQVALNHLDTGLLENSFRLGQSGPRPTTMQSAVEQLSSTIKAKRRLTRRLADYDLGGNKSTDQCPNQQCLHP